MLVYSLFFIVSCLLGQSWQLIEAKSSLNPGQLADANADLGISCNLQKWLDYKEKYWKSYGSKREDERRREIFCSKSAYVTGHNLEMDKLEHAGENKITRLAINHMSDWTQKELDSLRMKPDKLSRMQMSEESTMSGQDESDADKRIRLENLLAKLGDVQDLPSFVDYRLDKHIVSPAKYSQGHCGSCWAFATIGLIEAQEHKWNRSIEEVTLLSEQQLVDCIPAYGCNGGWPDQALLHVERAGGVLQAEAYPYISGLCSSDHKCHFKRDQTHEATRHLGKYEILPQGDEQLLKKVVALNGPVLSHMISSAKFHDYDGYSVFRDPVGCKYPKSIDDLTHVVLIVGYGTTMGGEDYWIIKNSWSQHWGNQGFGLMARNENDSCAIAYMPLTLF